MKGNRKGHGRGKGRLIGPMMDPRSKLLFAIGSDQRIKILEILKDGDKNLQELSRLLMLDPSVVSRHLSLMRDVGIVGAKKEGVMLTFFINDVRILKILDLATEIAKDWFSSFNKFFT